MSVPSEKLPEWKRPPQHNYTTMCHVVDIELKRYADGSGAWVWLVKPKLMDKESES